MSNIPNLLTLFRIFSIPLLVILFYIPGDTIRWLMLLLYIIACITDYLDGYLARSWHQVSALGKFLDPIADKLLIATLILMLTATNIIENWTVIPALVILCREILVSGLREFLANTQVTMPVSTLAKWKTLAQMISLGFLIIQNITPAFLHVNLIGQIGLWIAAIFTIITGYDYLKAGLKYIKANG
ncbi:MAG: CDP-diacylglycerol--glycerol-3-phosphate 3-phosphatidyltransferase [Alphaproteobacteria bacterium]|nr:CDP-diacylglycerol--glycerol-3-phosphate 3-phosphatidyltransferase [Alphaproteobacteria bacterium]